jgi:hypothetical protein
MLSSPYPMEQGQRSGAGVGESGQPPAARATRDAGSNPAAGTPEQSFQAEALRDMNRCEFCSAPFGSHASDCEGYASFVDFAEEYADEPREEAL